MSVRKFQSLAALILGVTTALSLSLTGCGSPAPSPTPASAAQEETQAAGTPAAGTPPPSVEYTVESLRLQTEQTPEALAKNLFDDVLPKWNMAGATDEMAEATLNYIVKNGDTKLAEYYDGIARKNRDVFSEAIFGPNPNERQSEIADDLQYVNKWALSMHFMTSDDQEPYRLWNTVTKAQVSSESGTVRVLYINVTEHDNSKSGLNGAEKIMANGNDATIEGNRRVAQITFDSASGSEIVTSWTIVPQDDRNP